MRTRDPNQEAQAVLNRRRHARGTSFRRAIRAVAIPVVIGLFVATIEITYHLMTKENEMAENDKQLVMRVPEDFLERADALIPTLAEEPGMRMFRVSRSAVLRMAIERGLNQMEERYATPAEQE